MLVFIDETGCDKRNAKRLFGYGVRGITPITHHLLAYGQRISAISIMSTRDVYLAEVSMETPLFSLFVATLIILSTI